MMIDESKMNKDQLLVDSVWPDWKLLEELGKGQFGTVYKACKHGFAGDSFSAIKIVTIDKDNQCRRLNAEQTNEFLKKKTYDYTREIKMMECVKGYSNVVNIEDYEVCENTGSNPWHVLIRMEVLKSLYEYLDGKNITDEIIARIGVDICKALEVCKTRKIVHRDIKPENVFVNDDGVFKLGDFGVARQILDSTSETRSGTPNFMAPELYLGKLQDTDFYRAQLADIYSLGMLLYWIANGERIPFVKQNGLITRDENDKAFYRIINGELLPDPVMGSESLKRVILKACSFEPSERYESAEQFRTALENIFQHQEKLTPKGKEKKKKGIIIGLLAVVLLAAGFVTGNIFFRDFWVCSNCGARNYKEVDSCVNCKAQRVSTVIITPTPTLNETRRLIAATVSPESGTVLNALIGNEALTTATMNPTFISTSKPTTTSTPKLMATPTPKLTATPTPKRTSTPTPKRMMATPTPTPKGVNVGDCVKFGTYKQQAGSNNKTSIEWLVLAVNGQKALLLSRYGLETMTYHSSSKDVTWKDSDIRKWLNNTFLSSAFTNKEKAAILKTIVKNNSSQGYNEWKTNGGDDTEDYVFLLSYAEANKYLGVGLLKSNSKARVAPTDYASDKKAYLDPENKTSNGQRAGWWWLRSPGEKKKHAAQVWTTGELGYTPVNQKSGCVRPALWINLETGIIQ